MIKLSEYVKITADGHSWFVAELHFNKIDYVDEYENVSFEHDPLVTGMDLAYLISADLENANYHSMVGFPENLWGIIAEAANEEVANKVLEKMYTDSVFQNIY